MEQYLRAGEAMDSKHANEVSCRSIASKLDQPESNPSQGFECNICLDLVQDPMVTLCGHLYCWRCIYKWIICSLEKPDEQKALCPVCKTEVSEQTLIPLYGRGGGVKMNPSKTDIQPIPKRPSTPLSIPNNTPSRFHHFLDHSRVRPVSDQPPPTTSPAPVLDPMIGGVLGEMVYARIFGNGETRVYHYLSSMTPRQQMQMTEVNRSLSRLCFFLCCCTVFCLLIF